MPYSLQNVSSDIFVEAVFLPCLQSGKLGQLQDQLTVVDPSFDSWNIYLTATCRYLNKNQYINTLYYMQLFMKVPNTNKDVQNILAVHRKYQMLSNNAILYCQ